ncbi:hypothetical protein D3C79_758950 [compost metagenome]
MLAGEAAQPLGQGRIDRERAALAAEARGRRTGIIQGQLEHGLLIAQLRLPVRQLPCQFAGFQPAALPQGIVDVLDRQVRQLRRMASGEGVVAAAELVDQHVHRPTIGNNVMQGQQQHMFLLGQAQQTHAQQRPLRQVEWTQ